MVMQATILITALAQLPKNETDVALELMIENAVFAFSLIVSDSGSVIPNITAVFVP